MINNKDVITSRQNPTVKRICALSDKKARREERLFRFDGVKLFGEALRHRLDVRYVVLLEEAGDAVTLAVENAVRCGDIRAESVLRVSAAVFEKLTEEKSPEGIITVAAYIEDKHKAISAEEAERYSFENGRAMLIAESIRDPGNLGTVIRSCAALGIERLLISDDCADLYSPKVIRAAMGGLFSLEIDRVPMDSLPDAIRALRSGGRCVYATALHASAERIGELKLRRGDCFVIGNEGHGLSKAVIEACGRCAIIPMTEGSESLNAAAAAAICIWETVR